MKPRSHSMLGLNTAIPAPSFPSKLVVGTSQLWLMASCATADPVVG
ncbi:hypothetical protein [Microcoleus sp. CAWBG51]|nr:hypothetical protein [Microcoleus sp. CAWBG51]